MPSALGWLLLLVCLVTGPSVAQPTDWSELKNAIRRSYPTVQQMTTKELALRLKGPAKSRPLLLDVRAEPEFLVSHLPGALWFRGGSETSSLALERGRPIVCYCSVGYRSSRVALRLQELGHKDVYNLEGSIFEWANQGRPLEGKSSKVHPYNELWGQYLKPDLRASPKSDP